MFPGLAVAAELIRRGHKVAVVFSGRTVESEQTGAGIPPGAAVWHVRIPQPKPKRPLDCIRWAWSVVPLFFKFLHFRPAALLAMGSYTSIPPVLAARFASVPVALHEANAVPGRAISFLSNFSRVVCTCFPSMERFFPRADRVVQTGLPLRAEFSPGIGGTKSRREGFNLLVMGGSQGARAMNALVVSAFENIVKFHKEALGGKSIRIVHLAGRSEAGRVNALWEDSCVKSAGIEIEVVAFETDMARRYAEADACISRAGASSCFELALAGVPAIFVPLQKLAGGHQVRNAEAFADAAEIVLQDDPEAAGKIAEKVLKLVSDHDLRNSMREKMLINAVSDAAVRVADALEGI